MTRLPMAVAGLLCAICLPLGATTGQCPAGAALPAPTAIVELYTSEGCSSCPPADRWLGELPRDGSVLALAFHVDYWDDLGWKDRFDDPAYTARQRTLQPASGARFVYTPQVLANGRDFPEWRDLRPMSLAAAAPGLPAGAPPLNLRRDKDQLVIDIGPAPSQGKLAGYWALVEDGHESQVGAGENAGRRLRHEHVVRRYQPVAAWPAAGAVQWRWTPPAAGPGHASQAVFVLTDAAGGRPLAARQINLVPVPGC